MIVQILEIPEVKVLTPRRFEDERGWFSETWSRLRLSDLGLRFDFMQENQSLSRNVGTLRGLHFQIPPAAQAKLVRVVRGRVWDVAVDIRRASPTFGRWVSQELSAEAGNQLLVPEGFAHGFCTLEPNSEVVYLVNNTYSPEHDASIHWADPALAIRWPVQPRFVSDKDQNAGLLEDFDIPF